MTDITKKNELKNRVRHVQKMASIGTLAGGIAHEFNNLLSIIVGNNEIAMEDTPDYSPVQESLEEIQIAAFRAREAVLGLPLFMA